MSCVFLHYCCMPVIRVALVMTDRAGFECDRSCASYWILNAYVM